MEPLMKWAGGKRPLLNDIKAVLDLTQLQGHRIYEPFVGGGAFFLDLAHDCVLINDINRELINVYRQIKENPEQLIALLKKHREHHSHDYYYEVRNCDRSDSFDSMSDVEKAARTVYLNRMCYNGLYRVNSKGQFNVPLGEYTNHREIVFEDKILEISDYLNNNNVEITSNDFEVAVQDATRGDLIYFDPPYDYDASGFTLYTCNGFSRNELKRLKAVCDDLISRGCKVVISNNDTEFVNSLFDDPKYNFVHVLAKRMINCKGQKRNSVKEVIIWG